MQCASSQGSRKGRVSRSLLPEVHSQSVTHQLSYLQLLYNAVLSGAARASLCLKAWKQSGLLYWQQVRQL